MAHNPHDLELNEHGNWDWDSICSLGEGAEDELRTLGVLMWCMLNDMMYHNKELVEGSVEVYDGHTLDISIRTAPKGLN